MAEHTETHDVETQASTSKRRPRLNEAPASPATTDDAKAQAERSPEWPAQYEGDGWDQVPAQMRP